MGSPSIPAQPAAPDYGTANKTAIQTDISTLPLRNQINQAAQLGQSITYKDPVTGEEKTADFTGMGSAAAAEQAAKILGQTNADMQRQQLALRQELGVKNVQQTVDELKAADPQGYALRQQLTQQAAAGLGQTSSYAPSANLASAENRMWNIANSAPDASGAGEKLATLYNTAGQKDPRLGNIYDQATKLPESFTDATADALNPVLRGALGEYALGGHLDDSELRDVTNNARAGQTARGNYLGDAAAVSEAMDQGSAASARKQQRLMNLLGIQSQAFGQGDALRNEGQAAKLARLGMMSGVQNQDFGQGMQRISQQAGLVGQDFGQHQQAYTTGLNAAQAAFGGTQAMANDQRTAQQLNFAQDQQRLANASAIALGAPVTNQFGSLGGAQQGAVGFTPVNYQPVGQLNQNAGAQGAQFAQGNFGTQAGMWGKSADIAAQGNPWMSLLGNVAGAAGGAAMAAMI